MQRKLLRYIIPALLLGQASFNTFAESTQEKVQNLIDSKLYPVYTSQYDQSLKRAVDDVLNRNNRALNRPKYCPLNNTRTYESLSVRLKNIGTVFGDNCLDGNKALVDKLINGTQNLDGEVQAYVKKKQGKPQTPVSHTIDGQMIGGMIGVMDRLLKSGKCSSLENTSWLEDTAEFFQTISQVAMFTRDGLTISLGGTIASKMLLFIDELFKTRFDFDNEIDINTFSKLNCSYYDIRTTLKDLKVFEIGTREHFNDQEKIVGLLKRLEAPNKSNQELHQEFIKELDKVKGEQVSSVHGELLKIANEINSKTGQKFIIDINSSLLAQVFTALDVLRKNQVKLKGLLTDFYNETNESSELMNNLFRSQLAQLEKSTDFLTKPPLEIVKSQFIQNINFNIERVIKFAKAKQLASANAFEAMSVLNVESNDITVAKLRKWIVEDKVYNAEKNKFKKDSEALEKAKKSIENIITQSRQFSNGNNKTGGLTGIIKNGEKIENHIYGKDGNDFVNESRKTADNQLDNFEDEYKDLVKDYDFSAVVGRYPNPDHLNEDEKTKLCAASFKTRQIWTYAREIAEKGRDFLVTNDDIFGLANTSERKSLVKHLDSSKLANRIVDALDYGARYMEYLRQGRTKMLYKGKLVTMDQAHALISNIQLNGRRFHGVSQAKEFLADEYWGSWESSKKIGKTLDRVNDLKPKALVLQSLYNDKKYNCK